jgi:Tol biopolymer transport system component
VRTRTAALVSAGLVLAVASAASALDEQVPDSLVFARNGDLFRITLDGAETVRLTTTRAREHGPAVSPDTLTIAYGRASDELWLMDAAGAGQRRIVPRRRSVRDPVTTSPSWSPDSRRIFFGRWNTPTSRCGSVFRIGADGRGLTRLTRDSASESDPAVSPDGRRIAVSASSYCDPGWAGRLAVTDTRGRTTRDLQRLRSPPGFDVQPSWSPDGERLAFVAWDYLESGRSAIYALDRDGSDLRRVTRSTFDTGGPAWSPDGEWIAFHKEGGLHVVRPDGSGLRRVPGTRNGDASPSWSPRT